MTETEQTPAPVSPPHQCYEITFALLSKLAAGGMVHADPGRVHEFMVTMEHAHWLLGGVQLGRWKPAPRDDADHPSKQS